MVTNKNVGDNWVISNNVSKTIARNLKVTGSIYWEEIVIIVAAV